jgi:hypothetical protein
MKIYTTGVRFNFRLIALTTLDAIASFSSKSRRSKLAVVLGLDPYSE